MANAKDIAAEVISYPAEDWLTDQYIVQAKYAVYDRALIADDGLKPVAKRALWSMFKGGLGPSAEHLKTSRVASDVVAYHPHAATSIEGTIARMAQAFALRVTLVDPAGSVGIVTGDVAAASRYWEARMTKAAYELVKEVAEGAVELGVNYDGKLDEPHVLPVRWPVAIINGTSGIAIGFASNMFAHNPDEVMEACRRLLKNPEMNIKQLMKIMPGPDLPTGGELLSIEGVKDYYETGSGGFIIRGRYTVEDMTRGKKKIIFYELPYNVSAEDVMSKIRDIQSSGGLKDVAVTKDLTDKKNGMRLVIETKSGTNHLAVIGELFKKTPLESKFSTNATVLVDGKPSVVSMLDLLRNFVEFRKEIVRNKANFRIEKIDARLKQVNAILAALLDIDKAIKIIRNSDDDQIAQQALMKAFRIDEEQADYILSMQLRRLTRSDSVALNTEKNNLQAERAAREAILKSEEKLIEAVDGELLETKKIISSPRRTIISGVTAEDLKEEAKQMAAVAKEENKNLPCFVTRFANGNLIKTREAFFYDRSAKKFPHGPIVEQISLMTQDPIVIVGSDGLGRRIPVSYIAPDVVSQAKDIGIDFPKEVTIVGISKNAISKDEVGLALVTNIGEVKVSKTDYPKVNEFPVVLLGEGERVVNSRWIGKTIGGSLFALISKAGNILTFDANSIRVAGSKSGAVKGMKLKDAEDEVIYFAWVDPANSDSVVITQSQKTISLTMLSDIPSKNKGGMGVAAHYFTKGDTALRTAFVGANPIASLGDRGNAVNLPPAVRRAAKGTPFDVEISLGASEVLAL